ncbi:MAG: hypothetical protein HQK68_04485 [Desulfamplus sp.]|nr:hypothetical protein [Desulfamplus sp.]
MNPHVKSSFGYYLSNYFCLFLYILCLNLFISTIFTQIAIAASSDSSSDDTQSTIIINSEVQYNYAVKLFEQHEFSSAIVEFSRFIYFFPDDNRVDDAKFKKGVSLLQTEQYEYAISIFKELSAPFFSNSNSVDSITIEAIFMLSSSLLKMKKDGAAEMVLQDFLLFNSDQSNEDRAIYALILIYLSRAQKGNISNKDAMAAIEKALEYIDKMTSFSIKLYKADRIKKDIEDTIKVLDQHGKNPVVAGVASIVPGGGFAYCNRYQDALIAFLLNSAFILASSESFNDGNSALGSLIGFIGFGFYGGNIYGAISSAHKHNRAIINSGIDYIKKGQNFNINQELNFNIDPTDNRGRVDKIPLLSITIPF